MDSQQWRIAHRFVYERWCPGRLLHRWRRDRRLRHFVRAELTASPFHAGLDRSRLDLLPIVDKAAVLADFAAFNRHRISLDQALTVAAHAERTRDFTPTIDTPDGPVTVGLSSGTTGRPGVFLIGACEQPLWAGTILAQLLDRATLASLATRPLRAVLFLRANSNLYQSVGGRRIRFDFHDTTAPLRRLDAADLIVGPPSVLAAVARLQPELRPRLVFSAAETLEDDDRETISAAWGVQVGQIYQATEGLLAVSCPRGTLHLNEGMVHIEPQWIDESRFVPIVTDFTRTTQFVVRYRLDDILEARLTPCGCGRPGRPLSRILGRADDVLELVGLDRQPVKVWPDVVRHALALAGLADYRLRQQGALWRIWLPDTQQLPLVRAEIEQMATRLKARPPRIELMARPAERRGDKRRRISIEVTR